MPRHQLIEVWVIGTKEKEVLLVGLGLSCSMVSNGTILFTGREWFTAFSFQTLAPALATTKNGLRSKP